MLESDDDDDGGDGHARTFIPAELNNYTLYLRVCTFIFFNMNVYTSNILT